MATCTCHADEPGAGAILTMARLASDAMAPPRASSEAPQARQVAVPHVVEVARELNVTLEVFRALADPVRLELLAYVAAHGPICGCHLEERLGYSQSRISKHLSVLRRAGLVSGETEPGSITNSTSKRSNSRIRFSATCKVASHSARRRLLREAEKPAS